MKTKFCFKSIFPLAITLAILCGCVREDADDCGNIRLLVVFDPDMYELPPDEHSIDNIDVYTFNKAGRYVSIWKGGSYDYKSGVPYEVPVDLPPGTYSFVAWTNTGIHYKTDPDSQNISPEFTVFGDIELYLEGPAGHRFDTDIPDLHYGRIETAVVDRRRNTEYTVYLIPDSYRINITVKGLEESADTLSVSISDNNTHYNFNNRVIESYPKDTHLREGDMREGIIKTSIRTLSLTDDHAIENIGSPGAADRSPELAIRNKTTDTELFSVDMVKIIRRAYLKSGQTVDFDKTYLFDIILTFDANLDVTISVNGWSYKYNPIEL